MKKLLVVALLAGLVTGALAQAPAAKAPPKVKVGDSAPPFTLLAFDGKEVKPVSLSDYKGKKNVVLAFYVFAFTGGWTKEMRSFQENLAKLEAADTQVLGVSMDSPFANFAFAQQNGVTFPLLSDMSGEATRAYGLLNAMEIKGVKVDSARRASFLINKEGKVEEVHVDSEALDPTKMVTICERKKKSS